MTAKLFELKTSQQKFAKGKAQMAGESVEELLGTLRAQMEQVMREIYGSPQSTGISGQLVVMRKEITADQMALRRELTEKHEELRHELSQRQEALQEKVTSGQTVLREDFIAAKSEMTGTVKGALQALGWVGAIILGIPAVGTFIFMIFDHMKK